MQSAIQVSVRVGLVAGVDDGPGPRRCAGYPFPDVVCALAYAVPSTSRGVENLPRARNDLTRNKERDEPLREGEKVGGTIDEEVLVTSVGLARRVCIVIEQIEVASNALFAEHHLRIHREGFQRSLPRPHIR